MTGRTLRVLYRLRYHTFAGLALGSWLVGLSFALALGQGLTAFGRPGWRGWLLAALWLVLGLGILALRAWGARRDYVVFAPQAGLQHPAARALDPTDKVALRASGRFEVQGKSHFFADLPAYWRSFATREHAVMAIVQPSRCLLVGSLPGRDLGMWYIFLRPETLRAVAAGRLAFGPADRPALAVTYQLPSPAQRTLWRRISRKGQDAQETVYLAFDDEESRCLVWADLLHDYDGG